AGNERRLPIRPRYYNFRGDYTKGIGVLVDFSAGTIESTDNPLDAAIQGDGFFTVDVNGQTQYTRNGHFALSSRGLLVNGSGQPVLDSAGGEIVIPLDAESVTITAEGAIATENGVVAELGIFKFNKEDQQVLNRSGNGGFFAPDTANPERANEDVVVMQGRLEVSNVEGIQEVVKLQELNKSYQQAMRAIRQMEDLEERAIRNIATPAR
ncbi:MAG: flagellar hook basal-body protein, partial [Alphaproteobacteria bacterium]|nr:flagellar hook basal-body protein [Alphaproteobacteria bacterium]